MVYRIFRIYTLGLLLQCEVGSPLKPHPYGEEPPFPAVFRCLEEKTVIWVKKTGIGE